MSISNISVIPTKQKNNADNRYIHTKTKHSLNKQANMCSLETALQLFLTGQHFIEKKRWERTPSKRLSKQTNSSHET
jgi:hypothetical protein